MLGASELHCTQSSCNVQYIRDESDAKRNSCVPRCLSLPNYYMFFFTPLLLLLLRNVDLRQKLLNIGAQTMCVVCAS